jgi:hypothetical protein
LCGQLVPGAAVEYPFAAFAASAAPLLEEERHALVGAAIPEFAHPVGPHWTMAGPGLAAGDQPIDPGQVRALEAAEQRLGRDELDVRRGAA